MRNRRFGQVARRSWLILLLGALIGGWAAYVFASRAAPTYQSSVSLVTGPINYSTNLPASGSIARTYADLATTAPVLLRAAQDAHIQATLKDLQSEVTATSNDVTRIVTIDATRHDPAEAARLANAISNRLIKLGTTPAGETPIDTFMADSAVNHLTAGQQAAIRQAAAKAFGDFSAGRLEVVDPARVATSAAGPRVTLITLLGVIAGLVVAAIAIFLREVTNEAIDSEDEIAMEAGVPVLGVIHASGRIAVPHDRSRLARECSLIASKLGVVGDGEVRSVLVTAADRDVGSGALAAGLASVLTERGLRILLVDADQTAGEATALLGLGRVPGYGDVVRSIAASDDAVPSLGEFVVEAAPGLSVLARGTEAAGPLDRARARGLLEHLVDEVDVVIVASAELGRAADPLVWASVCDATVLAVGRRRSTRESVARAVSDLRRAGARGLGAVLVQRQRPSGRVVASRAAQVVEGAAKTVGAASAKPTR
jgi:capsular polysaccharide biosynthesis protein/MinD-like ATPase involved in chromosome partitioning or flagellar assembly